MKSRRNEVTGILLIILAVFITLSLISYHPDEEPTLSTSVAVRNWMGFVGVIVSHYLVKFGLGIASFVIPFLMILWGWWIFARRSYKVLWRFSYYSVVLALVIASGLGLQAIEIGVEKGYGYRYAGLLGGIFGSVLHKYLGLVGSILLLLTIFLIAVQGYFAWSFYGPLERAADYIKEKKYRKSGRKKKLAADIHRKSKPAAVHVADSKPESEQMSIFGEEDLPELQDVTEHIKAEQKVEGEEVVSEETAFTVEKEVRVKEGDYDREMHRKTPRREYKLPSIELLNHSEETKAQIERDELVENARLLEETLMTFGVKGKVTHVSPGPIITRYEIEPAVGVRVSKIAALSEDIARIMEARSIRIVAPIPGKAVVGVEIPNKKPSIVFIRSIINSERFISAKSKLEIALGKTTSGDIYTCNLGRMPHLLIAGATGSGKSVCINTIIMSLLYKAQPNEVKMVLIDPKKLELSIYKALAGYHLITSEDLDEDIITKPTNAIIALRSIETEMEKRYDLLAEAAVRNIDEYNIKVEKAGEDFEKLPYIVVIIDEFADLMLTSAKEVEEPIARLAQMARAVGIHLIVATQRPSVDVLTGVIKANFPARIAFQVASKVDSRTILDMNGAEKLLGRGDMLFIPPGSPEALRLHNAYVTLEEIERVLNHIKSQPKAEEITLPSVRELKQEELVIDGITSTRDPLYNEALRLVVTHQMGSISLLQRRLRIGYSRAARLIDELEQEGIVGPFTGSKARDVLVDETYLENPDRFREKNN